MIIADRYGRYHFISGAIRAVPVASHHVAFGATTVGAPSKGAKLVGNSKVPESKCEDEVEPSFTIDLMRNGSGEHGGVSFFSTSVLQSD